MEVGVDLVELVILIWFFCKYHRYIRQFNLIMFTIWALGALANMARIAVRYLEIDAPYVNKISAGFEFLLGTLFFYAFVLRLAKIVIYMKATLVEDEVQFAKTQLCRYKCFQLFFLVAFGLVIYSGYKAKFVIISKMTQE